MLELLRNWVEAGLSPDSFWEQVPATYNAAMRGANNARRGRFEADRDLALMTAFFAGQLSQTDWEKSRIPMRFGDWLQQMTAPQKVTSGDRVAAFRRAAAAGFDVSVNSSQQPF